MSRPTIYGQPAHLHVRSVLFALAEKDVVYRVRPRDEMPLPGNRAAPRVGFDEPVLDIGGHLVQGAETALRFVADAFAGPALQPADARERARMNSALELNYREAVTTLGSQITGRYIAALFSIDWLDPKAAEDVLAAARKTVVEFEYILNDDSFLAGSAISLADIAVASLLDNIMETPDRDLVLPANSKLRLWWERVSARQAFLATRPRGGALFGFLYPSKPANE